MRQSGTIRRGLPAVAGVPATPDRRFRRSDVRPGSRRTWRAGLVRLSVLLVGCVAALAVAAWVAAGVINASVFRIERIIVRGTAQLDPAEVRALIEGVEGQSIFRVDLEEYRLRLADSRWIAQAALWRVFPDAIEVRIVERIPLAKARRNQQLFLVDATGIIDEAGPQYEKFDLPIVDGLLDGVRADPARIALVERLLAEVSARDDLLKRISQVNVTDARNAVVLLDGEAAWLQLGDTAFLQRLERWEELAPGVRDQFGEIDYWNLRLDRPVVGLAGRPGQPVDGTPGR